MGVMSTIYKRTKILATIGPASDSEEMIEKLIKAGINGARLNFSHGSYDEHAAKIKAVREISKRLGKEVAILQDLQGPKIRLGEIIDNRFDVKEGDEIVLDYAIEQHDGSANLPVQYNLAEKVKIGEPVFIFDGKVKKLSLREFNLFSISSITIGEVPCSESNFFIASVVSSN